MNNIIFVEPDGTAYIVPRIAGGKGGGSQTVVQQQQTGPWEKQQSYLMQGMEEAKKQYESGKPSFFPGSTVTPYSPETETALDVKTGQAIDPNSLVGQAGTETGRTLAGYHLGPESPAFQGVMRGIYNQTRPAVDTAFAQAGRGIRSPGYAEALGRGISTGMTPYLAAERGRMFDATQTALPVSQYAPGLLAEVGGAREAKSRDVLQEEIDRFNYEQNLPATKLAQYMQNVTGNYGGTMTGTATQPTYSNPLLTGSGVAASTAGIGRQLFSKDLNKGLFK